MQEGTAFDAEATTDDVLCGVDLSDKTAVVTGASSGLGAEVARALRAAGATVVAAVRRPASVDGPAVELDLASLDSVRAAAAQLRSEFERIDLLFANAGVMATPAGRTADGFDVQLGTNHLGHFLLTALLGPSLPDDGRVVATSSLGHVLTGMRWPDPHFEHEPYDKWQAYGQSKSANILFAKGLAARGRLAYSVHPGAIDTGLMRHLDGPEREFATEQGRSMSKSVEAGAATLVWAAVADHIPSGSYLADCAVADPAPHANDPAEVDRLWTWSEHQVGLADD